MRQFNKRDRRQRGRDGRINLCSVYREAVDKKETFEMAVDCFQQAFLGQKNPRCF